MRLLAFRKRLISTTNRKEIPMIPIFEQAHSLFLTPTESEILDWFENHFPQCLYMNLEEMSDQLYTSSATIVRFCQKLGFKGFNEFKYQLRQQLKEQKNSALFSDNIIEHSLALFRDNLEQLDLDALQEVANLLTSDCTIYICGSNLSSLIASYLHAVLSSLDYSCILIEWQRLLGSLIGQMSRDSVLLIASAHGDPQYYQSIMETAFERGIKTILLTCERDSPLVSLSSFAFFSNDHNQELANVDTNPRIGLFAIAQILIELVTLKKRHIFSTSHPTEEPSIFPNEKD